MALVQLFTLIAGTSLAFNGMMFLLMVRVDDPLVPRAMSGILATLSVVLPIRGYLSDRRISQVAPRHRHREPVHLRYSRLQAILLKEGGFAAIQTDLLFLFLFGIGSLLVVTPLFKRTL